MLVLAAADYVLSGIGGPRQQGGQWIDAVERQEDADATLRDKARELRTRAFDDQASDAEEKPLSLADAEQQVIAYLDGVERDNRT